MATLPVNTISRAGTDLQAVALAASAGGDKFLNTGVCLFYANNASVAPITLTIVFASGLTIDGQTVANRTVTMLAGKSYLVGTFPTAIYNDVDGYINFTYSGVTTLTVAALRPGT